MVRFAVLTRERAGLEHLSGRRRSLEAAARYIQGPRNLSGGGGGIRTHEGLASLPVFKDPTLEEFKRLAAEAKRRGEPTGPLVWRFVVETIDRVREALERDSRPTS